MPRLPVEVVANVKKAREAAVLTCDYNFAEAVKQQGGLVRYPYV